MSKKVTVIAVTGGPCGGKSSFLSHISGQLTERGYRVFQIAETATELILGGFHPFDEHLSMYEFQTFVFPMQFFKQELYRRAAEQCPEEKVVIVCDRGIPDNRAYVSPEEYDALLMLFGKTADEVIHSYDIVIHLVTTADGAEQAYTLSNNLARTETPELAREIDLRTQRAWQTHPRLRVIDNTTDFEGKLARATQAILELLEEE